MTEQVRKFMASDAMAYVDTYRKLLMQPPGDVTESLERLKTKMFEMNLVPPRLYAEMRAHEHAFNYLTKQQEPGMVILGDAKAEPTPQELAAAENEEMERLEDELKDAQKKLRRAAEHIQQQEAELVIKRQEAARLQRKIAQTYNSVAVAGAAMVVVLLVLLGIIISK